MSKGFRLTFNLEILKNAYATHGLRYIGDPYSPYLPGGRPSDFRRAMEFCEKRTKELQQGEAAKWTKRKLTPEQQQLAEYLEEEHQTQVKKLRRDCTEMGLSNKGFLRTLCRRIASTC